ncbi:MAG: FecR domain-containing protein [Leptospira sp.]|nr:FecR domain-containing protein [Leptospira sp.]
MNFLNRTAIVIPLLLIASMVLSVLLYLNITKKVEGGNNPTIGILTFKIRSIQRKYDGEVVWETIPTETEIKNRDTIRTVNLADATLTLEDGTEIQIGENSMILVDFSDKKWNLNFAYGSVGAKKGSNDGLNIVSGDSSIEVGSGELSLNKSGDDLSINITKGDSKLKVGDEEKTISQDQTATIGKEGVSVKQQNYRLVKPLGNSIITTTETSKSIDFSWTLSGNRPKKSELVVSNDPRFRQIISKTSLNSDNATIKLKPGSYYWKITYSDENNKPTESSTSRFTLFYNDGIKLFTPTNNSRISYNSNFPKPISFSWSKSEIVSFYRLEISDDENFNNIIERKETRNNSIAITGLKQGNLFYRVIGKSSISGESDIISETRSFSLDETKELSKVSLVEPSNQRNISLPSLKDSGILFSWKDTIEYNQYNFQLATDESFSSVLRTDTSNKNFYRWNSDIKAGKYFWRVTGINSNNEKMTSQVREFNISEDVKISLIRPSQEIQLELQDGKSVNFGWKPLPNTGKTNLIISKAKELSDPVFNEIVSGNSKSVNLKNPGKYFWRINWSDGKTDSISDIYSFDLVANLPPPKITFPRASSSVDMTRRDDLLIQWNTVPEADLYFIRLLDTTGLREREILASRVNGNSYRFRDLTKLNQGKFRIELKSLSKKQDGGFTESRVEKIEFFITLTTGITTKILTPERIYVE